MIFRFGPKKVCEKKKIPNLNTQFARCKRKQVMLDKEGIGLSFRLDTHCVCVHTLQYMSSISESSFTFDPSILTMTAEISSCT